MLRRWWWCGILAVMFCSPLMARDGMIQTTDGKRLQGDIQDVAGLDSVAITDHGVVVTIPRSNITRIEYTEDMQSEFSKRLANMAPTDVRGRVELSRWALDRNLFVQARQAALDAQAIDPSNSDAQMLLQEIQSQQILQNRQAAATQASEAATPTIEPTMQDDGAFLSESDVNVIRQWEIKGDLRQAENVHVTFSPTVFKEYLSRSGADAKAFNAATPVSQAMQIIQFGDPELSAQVQILDDPLSLFEFHSNILPQMLVGCASSGCHGGKNGQEFFLHRHVSKPVGWYTDFYILRTYEQKLSLAGNVWGNGPMLVPMIDTSHPTRSLAIQYGLPRNLAAIPHPDVVGFRPLYRDEKDPGYLRMINWIGQSLKPFDPDYGIQFVLPTGVAPATQSSMNNP
jgi:hypothetical protein